MKQIVVIDPGMMEAGGHHAALLETLFEAEKEDVNLAVFSHKQLDKNLADKAFSGKIELHKHFETNFYQFYDNGLQLKVSGLQQYIRRLATEYREVFKLLADLKPQEETVCFYPCLNWEHASALFLAISSLRNELPIIHKICCMFVPTGTAESSSCYYRLGFSALSKMHNVELYATDWETQAYYLRLNIRTKGFHPCYLLHWDKVPIKRHDLQKTPHFLLYMGDAKINKGFTQLPELVESYIKKYEGNVNLTIQFTLSWDNPELTTTRRKLLLLNRKYVQLNLHESFWTTSELIEAFQGFTGFVCTYNPLTYKNKSSGLTWLAAYFNLHVVVRESCWIVRELERLGNSYNISNSLFIEQESVTNNSRNTSYYQDLFANLIAWLKGD